MSKLLAYKTIFEINPGEFGANFMCKRGAIVSADMLANTLHYAADNGINFVNIQGLENVYFSCDGSDELKAELLTKRVPDAGVHGCMQFVRGQDGAWGVEKDGSKGVFSAQYVARMANV